MHYLALWMLSASAGELGVELGAQGGLGWQGPEPIYGGEIGSAIGGTLAPRLTLWVGKLAGLELDVPLGYATDEGHALRWVSPRLSLLLDPVGEGSHVPLRPMLSLGAGVERRTWKSTPFLDVPAPWARNGVELHAGASAVFPVAGALRLRLTLEGGATVLAAGSTWVASPRVGLTLGVSARFRLTADGDHDGVPDYLDTCPGEDEDLDGHDDADGCPDRDNDLDGVRDELDSCVDQPEDIDNVDDEDGCPE